MTNITKHDSEHEWESDRCEQSRVDLLVGCNTVGVHDCLETFGELVGLLERWGCLVGP